MAGTDKMELPFVIDERQSSKSNCNLQLQRCWLSEASEIGNPPAQELKSAV